MIKFIEIPKANKIQKIIDAIKIARIASGDYVEIAKKELESVEILSEEDVAHFLDVFNWDKYLVDTLLSSGKTSDLTALNIVHRTNYRLNACICACETHADNENFLLTIIIQMTVYNHHRCRIIIDRFSEYISKNGFNLILKQTFYDPVIANIAKRRYQMTV